VQGTAVPESGLSPIARYPLSGAHTISAAIRQQPPRLISSSLPPSFASRYARRSIGQVLQACSASRLHLSAIIYPPIRSLWQVPSRPSVGVQSWQARQGKRPADWSQMRNDHREAPLLSRLFLESSMTYHTIHLNFSAC
jgi:hypothetical protein